MTKSILSSEILAKRRSKLAAEIKNGSVLLVGSTMPKRHDVRIRPDTSLYYLTGITEPESALILQARAGKIISEVAYCKQRDRRYESWHGKLLGPGRTKSKLGLAEVKPWPKVERLVAEALRSSKRVFVSFDSQLLAICARMLNTMPGMSASSVHDLRPYLARLRSVKDAYEIEKIKDSCALAASAHRNVLGTIGAFGTEAKLAALLSSTYNSAGAHHAFTPIVGCGRNACVAHYTVNSSRLANGKLVLVDSGCELDAYCSDITRVYAVDGSFTPAQKDLYSIVLAAQRAAIRKVKPGNTFMQANNSACRILAEGLRDLGICKGSTKKIMDSELFGRFVIHSIGHSLGLDVHDSWNHSDKADKPTKLKRNMIVTIEPGMYLDDSPAVPRELRRTGIRIEDVVQVTSTMPSVLTEDAPKKLAQISA